MKEEFKWEVPEYPQYERSFRWYVVAALLGIILLIYAVVTGNFLFSVIIILGVSISILTSSKTPKMVTFKLEEDGARINDIFYSWDRFKSYWVVEHSDGVYLGLDLKNIMRIDIYVPVKNYSLKEVEIFLNKYLKINPDRKEEPLSYTLARKLKI